MTIHDKLMRPASAIRLGVVGHRDLEGVDREVLRATIARFLAELRHAVEESLAALCKEGDPNPYLDRAPLFFLVDPLAEGADQLVAEAAVEGGEGYSLRCPIPFTIAEYKSMFSFDAARASATFDRLVGNPEKDGVVVELACSTADDERGAAYAAAADVLLENSDLLLAIYDPSRAGSTGGTAETLAKAGRLGMPVVGIDTRSPETVELLSPGADRSMNPKPLTSDALREIACGVLLPAGACVHDQVSDFAREQLARLRRFLREPLITGGPVQRGFAEMLGAAYRAFWLIVPALGWITARLRRKREDDQEDLPPSLPLPDSGHLATIDGIQRPHVRRMVPMDRLASLYMSLYQGSFVMNFLFGAMAVLFALLAYFNPAHQTLWLWAEMIALLVILANYVASRARAWHDRALDYRFVAEYLRQTTMLAPLCRVAPLVRPSAQYGGHDPWATWMGWYVRALHRDQGVVEFEPSPSPKILRMDDSFLAAMRYRICEDWLKPQYRYYSSVRERSEAAASGIRVLMGLLFACALVAMALHSAGVSIELDESAWRDGALLTLVAAIAPAFLGALHGIAVQSDLDLTAGRARDIAADLARRIREIAQPTSEADHTAVVLLTNQAVEAAHMMLAEVLDWRIIHQAHEVELT